jgi:AcrR family transcriptional regulator
MAVVAQPKSRNKGKKGDTRRRIIRSAARLFATNGYAATSIAAICEAAGVVPTSIYWEFGSKAGVLEAVLEDSAQRWRTTATRGVLKAAAGGDRLDAYFDYMAKTFTKSPEFPRLMLMVALERGHKDHRALEIIRSHRVAWITELSELLPRLGLGKDSAESPTRYQIAELIFACLDGAFVSGQIDPDAARLESMLGLFDSALRARLLPSREAEGVKG